MPAEQALKKSVILYAERTGFEPVVQFDSDTSLAMMRIRPLCHLSGRAETAAGAAIPAISSEHYNSADSESKQSEFVAILTE